MGSKLKVGLSSSKKCFNGSQLKTTKNFILKALFALNLFVLCHDFLDIKTLLTSNYNTHIAQYPLK